MVGIHDMNERTLEKMARSKEGEKIRPRFALHKGAQRGAFDPGRGEGKSVFRKREEGGYTLRRRSIASEGGIRDTRRRPRGRSGEGDERIYISNARCRVRFH